MKYLSEKAIRSMVTALIYRNFNELLTAMYGVDSLYKESVHDDYRNRALDNIIEPITEILGYYRRHHRVPITKELMIMTEKSIYDILILWCFDTDFCNKISKLIIDTFFDGVEIDE